MKLDVNALQGGNVGPRRIIIRAIGGDRQKEVAKAFGVFV
jgi:hypothetical protein